MNPLRHDDPRHLEAVEAAAAKINRFGWPYRQNATAVIKQMLPAYYKSLKEQGVVLVEAYAGDDAGRT